MSTRTQAYRVVELPDPACPLLQLKAEGSVPTAAAAAAKHLLRTLVEFEAESASTMRHDGTIIRITDPYDASPQTLGWIPLGRDTSLEQVILRDIFGRITQSDRDSLIHH